MKKWENYTEQEKWGKEAKLGKENCACNISELLRRSQLSQYVPCPVQHHNSPRPVYRFHGLPKWTESTELMRYFYYILSWDTEYGLLGNLLSIFQALVMRKPTGITWHNSGVLIWLLSSGMAPVLKSWSYTILLIRIPSLLSTFHFSQPSSLLSETTESSPASCPPHSSLHTHCGCCVASPEVDTSSIAGNVEHYDALKVWQGDDFPITLKEKSSSYCLAFQIQRWGRAWGSLQTIIFWSVK